MQYVLIKFFYTSAAATLVKRLLDVWKVGSSSLGSAMPRSAITILNVFSLFALRTIDISDEISNRSSVYRCFVTWGKSILWLVGSWLDIGTVGY